MLGRDCQCLARATLRERFAILYRSGFIKTEGFGSALEQHHLPVPTLIMSWGTLKFLS